MTAPIVLIDGSSYFYRAFHALPPLTNSKGQATGAIYGVVNMIKRLIKDYQPEHIAVIFDAKGKTFRDEWYPEYKANRAAMPDDLRSQFEPMVEFLKAMGLPLLVIDGVEADDVIGTLAVEAANLGHHLLISTGDKDMAQLVNPQVTLINTMSNKLLDIGGVKEKFGVTPSQIIDYLTLTGDTSDNIKGVDKCGTKTAAKWLAQYQTLDNLLANVHEITGKIGESLRGSMSHLPLSKRLVTIKTDVPLPLKADELTIKARDTEKLIAFCKEFEFKAWLKELLAAQQIEAATPNAECAYSLINTEVQLKNLVTQLSHASTFCIGLKTRKLDNFNDELVGISCAINRDVPMYIPLNHEETTTTSQLSQDLVFKALAPVLSNPNIGKIGDNLKYDYNIFKQHEISLKGIIADTMLESYVLDSSANRHDLNSLSLKFLGHSMMSFEDIAGKGRDQLSYHQIAIEKAAPYAAERIDVTLQLHQLLDSQLNSVSKSILQEIEIPLLSVLADMERYGVLIDKDTLAKHGARLKERLVILEKEIFSMAGLDFNINSPKQLQEILFEKLQLPVVSKTPTGQPSTAESVLQELAIDYALPKLILEYRSLSKLVSTYIDALPKRENPATGRVHTSYNQAVTATGRLSSSEPNLQNIPIRSEEGRLIRKAFIAPPNHVLIAADYSQIELRIMAHLSGDKGLLTAFENNLDIHTATAAEIFELNISDVDHEHRRRAKAVNFGLIYGMSSFGLARQLGISRKDAQLYIDRYFLRYPGVLRYMEETRARAHEHGYVETIYGRRLYVPEIHSKNLARVKAAERIAINAPMQGTAADIIKKAMITIAQWINTLENPYITMIMQVHDELVFEVHQDFIEEARAKIQDLMENTSKLSVPLEVSIGIGNHWDEAH